MKIKILYFITLFIFGALAASRAQITNTNAVIIYPGDSNWSGNYTWNPGSPGAGSCWVPGFFTNDVLPAVGPLIDASCGTGLTWVMVRSSDNHNIYITTNFPYGPWFSNDVAAQTLVLYGNWLISYPPIVSTTLTNFFPMAGDSMTFSASGRNMAPSNNPAALEVVFGTNVIYCSTPTAGNGSLFSVNGRVHWDGTNIDTAAFMDAGDPSNIQTAQFNFFTNVSISMAAFQIISSNNAQGFILYSSQVTAARATNPFTAMGVLQYHPGSINLVITN